MAGGPQQRFLTAELDPALLCMPFEVYTNWHVITGAPCCGKTTLVEQLAARGFATVPERRASWISGWPGITGPWAMTS